MRPWSMHVVRVTCRGGDKVEQLMPGRRDGARENRGRTKARFAPLALLRPRQAVWVLVFQYRRRGSFICCTEIRRHLSDRNQASCYLAFEAFSRSIHSPARAKGKNMFHLAFAELARLLPVCTSHAAPAAPPPSPPVNANALLE